MPFWLGGSRTQAGLGCLVGLGCLLVSVVCYCFVRVAGLLLSVCLFFCVFCPCEDELTMRRGHVVGKLSRLIAKRKNPLRSGSMSSLRACC